MNFDNHELQPNKDCASQKWGSYITFLCYVNISMKEEPTWRAAALNIIKMHMYKDGDVWCKITVNRNMHSCPILGIKVKMHNLF